MIGAHRASGSSSGLARPQNSTAISLPLRRRVRAPHAHLRATRPSLWRASAAASNVTTTTTAPSPASTVVADEEQVIEQVVEPGEQAHAADCDPHVVLDKPTPKRAEILRNIVFVSSEVAPWSKTGGLGDVMGALPKALAARGHRVMVVAPRYANYPEALDTGVGETDSSAAQGSDDTMKRHTVMGCQVGYFHHESKGVDYVFVDHPSFPRPGGLYSDKFGEYGDNQFRYTLLTLAALEAPLVLPLGEQGLYGQDVMFMANDWHTALVPVFLAAKYRAYGVYLGARSILAIHNLKHQGVFPPGTFGSLELPGHWYKAVEWQYPPHQRMGSYAEEGRAVNYMKAGIITADRIVTVSPGYADEIKSWMGGWGMDGLLSQREYVLNGITNGIDEETWNPATDKHIAQNYDIDTFLEGKAACKKALQEELGLPVNQNIPLLAFIGRLDNQKGADILLEAAGEILRTSNVQLVCLGTGNKDLEDGLRWLEGQYRDRARGWVGFNEPFSHRLTAGADMVLMPSRFEPCGLNQLYAMRYGAVPIAHKTGGLKDTVLDFNPWEKSGTGWTYTSCDAGGLKWAIGMALRTWNEHRQDFVEMQRRGMERDSSWDLAAQQYEQCMNWAAFDHPYCK